jgi:hypothetical protein
MLTAVLLAPLAVLFGQVLGRDGRAIVPTATVIGVLAALVQFLGLARWPFLVPTLARTYDDPASSEATRLRCSSRPFRRLARLARHRDRPHPDRRLPRVRRPIRGERLETCRQDRPDCLHRLVAVAGDLPGRASYRMTSPCPGLSVLPPPARVRTNRGAMAWEATAHSALV